MSWTQLSIQSPAGDFANSGQLLEIITLDPWTSWVADGDDNFATLSFTNAVDAAIAKIGGSDKAVFAIALCANSVAGLTSEVAILSAAFPMPYFQRIERMAKSVDGLKESRMVLAKPSSQNKNFNIGALQKVQGIQKADLIQQAKSRADNHQLTNPVENLDDFVAEKSSHNTAVSNARTNAVTGLSGGTGWRFYAESNISEAIKSGHPSHEMAYTAMMLFMGSPAQLSFLTDIFP